MALIGPNAAPATPLTFEDLSGWRQDDHGQTLDVFKASCNEIVNRKSETVDESALNICRAALALPDDTPRDDARRFFEFHFKLAPVLDGESEAGLFTGYYEPEIDASPTRSNRYSSPLRSVPAGIVSLAGLPSPPGLAGFSHGLRQGGSILSLPDREAIEAGALDEITQIIAWLDPVDAFFLHVQGSGRLRYPGGSIDRVGYAGKNGHPYTSIGKYLVETGVMNKDNVSMQNLRDWLGADLERAARVLHQNRSYVFFRQIGGMDLAAGPIGQQGIALTAGRSLAADLNFHPTGSLLWLETTVPGRGGNGVENFSHAMVVQDTGSAIKGPIRGDIFFGSGDEAGARAGHMRAQGRFVALVPHQ